MGHQGWLAAGIVAAMGLSAVALVLSAGGREAAAPGLAPAAGAIPPTPAPELSARLDALEERLALLEQAAATPSAPAGTSAAPATAGPGGVRPAGPPAATPPERSPAAGGFRPRTTLTSGDPVPTELPRLLDLLQRLGAKPTPAHGSKSTWFLGNAVADALDTDRAVLLESFLARRADHPDAQGYLLRLLHLHTAWGRHERVIALLDRYGAAAGIEAPRLLALRGGARARAGDHAGSRRDYEPLMRDERVPPHIRFQAHLAVGNAFDAEGDHAAARAVYEQMLTDPAKLFRENAGAAHLAIARSHRDEGNRAEAIAAYRKLLDLEQDGSGLGMSKVLAKSELAALEKDG
ncbi:MAG: hypothetical protein ACYTGX_16595 [Planctomycetota bacterium]|jgi:hypothetical protein